MYILSLSFGLSIHNSVDSWPNHFKFSTAFVDKRTSGCRSITSSIYLNWNMWSLTWSFRLPRYYVIIIFKLEYRRYLLSDRGKICFNKSRMMMTFIILFCKNFLCHLWSSKDDVIEISIADISLIIRCIDSQIGQRYLDSTNNLEVCKIKCELEGHLDLLGQLQCKWIFSLFFFYFSFHNSVSSWPNHFKFWTVVVEKGNSGCMGIMSSISLNWHISVISYLIEHKLAFAKSDWWSVSVF